MKLAERSYWAIYFAPQPTAGSTIKGGDAYVFIDRVTGEVMGTLFGK